MLSTVSKGSKPHSVGVNYGVSRPGRDFVIYVMTRKHLQKARTIAQNPNISLVVPLTRRLLWFLPPPTIQLHGQAEIVDWTDEEGTDVFRRFGGGQGRHPARVSVIGTAVLVGRRYAVVSLA